MKKSLTYLLLAGLISACNTPPSEETLGSYPEIGKIILMDIRLLDVLDTSQNIEVIARGFEWAEGPLWIEKHNFLIFSDVPENRIYKWSKEDSISVYLEPSGFTKAPARVGEEGSNGLLLDPNGQLVLCQHGDRRIARLNSALNNPQPEYETVTDNWQDKRFNSPNDAVYDSNGNLYFTDPPYGLIEGENDPLKEIAFQGVYRYSNQGQLTLLTDELSRPNGIALSPDERYLYVANSDPSHAVWMIYDLTEEGSLSNGRILFDATEMVGNAKGLPDGMKVTREGYLFATGPGGVLVLHPDGTHLGTIATGEATANVAFDNQEETLFMTADMILARLKIKNK